LCIAFLFFLTAKNKINKALRYSNPIITQTKKKKKKKKKQRKKTLKLNHPAFNNPDKSSHQVLINQIKSIHRGKF